jgi:hypothetical protein
MHTRDKNTHFLLFNQMKNPRDIKREGSTALTTTGRIATGKKI